MLELKITVTEIKTAITLNGCAHQQMEGKGQCTDDKTIEIVQTDKWRESGLKKMNRASET